MKIQLCDIRQNYSSIADEIKRKTDENSNLKNKLREI